MDKLRRYSAFSNSRSGPANGGRPLLWREKRKPQTLTKVYHNAANQVLKLTANLRTNDDEEVLARLALVLEEIALEDWNDACVCNFCKKLKDTLQSICDADYGNVDAEEASFSIAIKRADEFIERRVMDADISMIGKTLMNNLRYSFEEYGDSIASDEKVAILVEMLKEMIGEA